MGLTDLAVVQMAMKQAGLQEKTSDVLDWLIKGVEGAIKSETGRKVFELGAQIKLEEDLDDSETDVDIRGIDYHKVELDQILLVDSEQMKITGKDDSPTLTVSRAYGGTTAATHSSGAKMKIVGMEEYRNGKGLDFFYTKEYPIVSVTSLHDDSDREYGSDTLVATDDYVWHRDGKIELETGYFYDGLKNVKIVYNAGYSPLPFDLQRLATEWVMLSFKGLDRLGVSTITSPDGSINMFYEFLTPELKRILRKYTRPFDGV